MCQYKKIKYTSSCQKTTARVLTKVAPASCRQTPRERMRFEPDSEAMPLGHNAALPRDLRKGLPFRTRPRPTVLSLFKSEAQPRPLSTSRVETPELSEAPKERSIPAPAGGWGVSSARSPNSKPCKGVPRGAQLMGQSLLRRQITSSELLTLRGTYCQTKVAPASCRQLPRERVRFESESEAIVARQNFALKPRH
jgi:hypothetical protein